MTHPESTQPLLSHAQKLQALAQASLAIASAQTLPETVTTITEQARRIIGAHQAVTSLTTDENGAPSIHAVSVSDKYAAWRPCDEKPDDSGIYSLLCRMNRPVRMTQEELEAHPDWKESGRSASRRPPMRGWLAAPLTGSGGKNTGLIQLSDKYEGEFTPEDEYVLTQLAQFASVVTEKAASEQALRESEKRLKLVTDHLPALISYLDRECFYRFNNAQYGEWFGVEPSSLTGKHLREFTGEEILEQRKPYIARVLAGETVQFEGPTRHHRLGLRQTAITYAPDKDENGSVQGFYAMIHDITEQKTSEEALRNSERIYRAIGESIDYGIWICDASGANIYASESFLKLVGLTQEECSRLGWGSVLHPDDAAETLAAWQECVRTGKPWDREHRYLGVDGQWHPVLARGVPIRDPDGKILWWAGINLDISALKDSENRLREYIERMAIAQRAAQFGIFDHNIKLNINEWSEEVMALYGLKPGEFEGTYEGWVKRLHPDDLPKAMEEMERAYKTGDYSCDFRVIWPDGSVHWLFTRAEVFYAEDGTPARILGVNVDITERKRGEEALKQYAEELARSNRELEQFAYVSSHDLQEPLRTVTSFTELLEMQCGDVLSGESKSLLRVISNSALRASRIILDLLEYSRIRTIKKKFSVVDMEAVLQQVIAGLHTLITEKRTLVTHDPLPSVLGDPVQLNQLLQNLIQNSIKFMSPERTPEIHIGVSPDTEKRSGEWIFSVRDNGIGIGKSYLEKIFVIFQRLHTEQEYPGTGLGLAICRKIVEHHGGRIWAESAPGAGSTFSFTLPALPPSQP